jgi:hypothetical protein
MFCQSADLCFVSVSPAFVMNDGVIGEALYVSLAVMVFCVSIKRSTTFGNSMFFLSFEHSAGYCYVCFKILSLSQLLDVHEKTHIDYRK